MKVKEQLLQGDLDAGLQHIKMQRSPRRLPIALPLTYQRCTVLTLAAAGLLAGVLLTPGAANAGGFLPHFGSSSSAGSGSDPSRNTDSHKDYSPPPRAPVFNTPRIETPRIESAPRFELPASRPRFQMPSSGGNGMVGSGEVRRAPAPRFSTPSWSPPMRDTTPSFPTPSPGSADQPRVRIFPRSAPGDWRQQTYTPQVSDMLPNINVTGTGNNGNAAGSGSYSGHPDISGVITLPRPTTGAPQINIFPQNRPHHFGHDHSQIVVVPGYPYGFPYNYPYGAAYGYPYGYPYDFPGYGFPGYGYPPNVVYVPQQPQVVYVPQSPDVVYVPEPTSAPNSNPNGATQPETSQPEPAPDANSQQSPEPYMPYNRPDAGRLPAAAQRAIVDIQEAWVLSDASLVQRHVDPAVQIRIYKEGKFDYAATSDDYLSMTRKALGAVITQSFTLPQRTVLADGRVRACGSHVFYDPENHRQTIYICYWLQQVNDRWLITAIDTSAHENRALIDPIAPDSAPSGAAPGSTTAPSGPAAGDSGLDPAAATGRDSQGSPDPTRLASAAGSH